MFVVRVWCVWVRFLPGHVIDDSQRMEVMLKPNVDPRAWNPLMKRKERKLPEKQISDPITAQLSTHTLNHK